MHSFKGGDVVRRIGTDFRDVFVGETYVVSDDTSDMILTLKGHSGSYTAEKFVLVKAFEPEKTNQELADEYRRLRQKAMEIAVTLKNAGYSLSHRKSNGVSGPVIINDSMTHTTYKFERVVTTTEEI